MVKKPKKMMMGGGMSAAGAGMTGRARGQAISSAAKAGAAPMRTMPMKNGGKTKGKK
jgi:hypothetical protein